MKRNDQRESNLLLRKDQGCYVLLCYLKMKAGEWVEHSPYKVETLTLIRNYPTQFPTTSSCSRKAAYVYQRPGNTMFLKSYFISHITFDVMTFSTFTVMTTLKPVCSWILGPLNYEKSIILCSVSLHQLARHQKDVQS